MAIYVGLSRADHDNGWNRAQTGAASGDAATRKPTRASVNARLATYLQSVAWTRQVWPRPPGAHDVFRLLTL